MKGSVQVMHRAVVGVLLSCVAIAAACSAFDEAPATPGSAPDAGTDATASPDATSDGAADAGRAPCDGGTFVNLDFTQALLPPPGFVKQGSASLVHDPSAGHLTPGGSLTASSDSRATAYIERRITMQPQSVRLAYSLEVLDTYDYSEMGCMLGLEHPDQTNTIIVTGIYPSRVGVNDVYVLEDGGSASGAGPTTLFGLSDPPNGWHRIEIEIPTIEVGNLQVKVKADNEPPQLVTYALYGIPQTILLKCGMTYAAKDIDAGDTKRARIDDVSLELCPR